MDPAALEKAFAMYPEVKLVVYAELYGFPGNIKQIKEICEKHGALLVEDAAEAIYGRIDDGYGESNSSIGIELNAHWYFHSTKDICFTFVNPVFEQVKSACGKKVFYMEMQKEIL